MSEDVTLAEYLAAFAGAGVDPGADADAMFRLSLFDWAICAVAGAGEQVSRIARDFALHEAGAQESSVVGSETRYPARMAAMVNGATSHALDYDDTHFAHIGHPSVAVIPAALAVAEAEGAPMADFCRAALLGAEASIRTGVWLGRSHYQAGFHQTATAGAIGATLASVRLMGLPDVDAANAFGLVGTRASGLKSQFGTMGKPMNAGLAAANGVEAAMLARRGFEAASDGLDGAQGFGATHAGQGDEAAFDGMGEHWMIETISHKFHACCHGLHALLEALAGLDGDPGDIATLTIHANPRWQNVCNIDHPKSGLEAKFSFRHAAALALAGYPTAAIGSYDAEITADPRLADLRKKVDVQFDDALSETEAMVRAEQIGGGVVQRTHDLSAPLSFVDREARLKRKGDVLVGATLSKAIWSAAMGDDLRALTALLRG